MEVEEDELVLFLVKAKQKTFGKEADGETLSGGGKERTFAHGPFTYTRTRYGENKFAGHEIVHFRDAVAWAMNFYGFRRPHLITDKAGLQSFLREALRRVDTNEPFRGPGDYKKSHYWYYNTVEGEVSRFQGEEIIYRRGEEVHRMLYHGGRVEGAAE